MDGSGLFLVLRRRTQRVRDGCGMNPSDVHQAAVVVRARKLSVDRRLADPTIPQTVGLRFVVRGHVCLCLQIYE